MSYSLVHIASVVQSASVVTDCPIDNLLLDSRKVYSPANSLFFALEGTRRDGHQYIPDLYKKGIRNFVVSKPADAAIYPGANFIVVANVLTALQQLAAYHRRKFSIPVIGITGSNGKTIVKEWLYQLLHRDYNIVRSPKSYNSQIGVPLSVWQMNAQHTLAIFEAGISQPGEMEILEKIIQPTIAIITNIGEAHSEGFLSKEQKQQEKSILLKNAIQPEELTITAVVKDNTSTRISALKHEHSKETISISIPFTDDASVNNAISCWRILLMLGYDNGVIDDRMKQLLPVHMRLELKKGINNCSVINDSYSADLSSLNIALSFLSNQSAGTKKTVILSDFLQTGLPDKELYQEIAAALQHTGVHKIIGIGEMISAFLPAAFNNSDVVQEYFFDTASFIQHYRFSQFKDETILVKGARIFEFEKIVQLLEQKVHQTVLEINLNALVHNVKTYQQHIQPSTKIMAMVKAFAYGSGGAEIASILQYQQIDYLGVAYADEGVELRKAGVTLPIMVMNPEETAFESIIEHNLEPDIYSFELLHSFESFIEKEGLQQYPVHLEIETGMNRLGFATEDINKLADHLGASSFIKLQSVFSHLAASEDASQDAFSFEQFDRFTKATHVLQQKLSYTFLRHISNTAAIFRLPALQLDMVRLGIGMYGIDNAAGASLLQPVATLKSTIAQLKYLKAGETVSYNRRGVVTRDSLIATVRIGYADGYSRRLGNGAGKMWLKGKLADVMGTICMDMTMIDVTDIPGVQEGDEVIIFGKELPVQQLAAWAGTIPYEIMTSISQRVKRVYFEE